VDSSTAEQAPSGAGDLSGIEVSDDCEGAANELPTRPVPGGQLARKIRRLDDPEILQRVLAGLLNLR
jgi:hypothetical protein